MCKDLAKSAMAQKFKEKLLSRKMPEGLTKTEYDSDKLKDKKKIAMEQWKGVPGFSDAEDFTWHHVIPQSKIKNENKIGIASDPLLVRLGPSVEKRDGDPGNEYVDYNFTESGTLTPFSEAVDDSIHSQNDELNLEELNNKLLTLVKDQKGSESGGSTNPGSWFIPIDKLRAIVPSGNLAAKMKTVIDAYQKPILYMSHDGKEPRLVDTKAVCVLDLRKPEITKALKSAPESEAVFKEFDRILKGQQHIYVRAYLADELQTKMAETRRNVAAETMLTVEGLINANKRIKVAAALLEAKVEQIERLVKTRAQIDDALRNLQVFNQADPGKMFYPGASVVLDLKLLKRCNDLANKRREWGSITIEARQLRELDLPTREANTAELELLPLLLASFEDYDEDALREEAEEAAQQELEDLGYHIFNPPVPRKKKKESPAPIDPFIVTNAEKEELENGADLKKLAQGCKERGVDLEAFRKVELEKARARILAEKLDAAERKVRAEFDKVKLAEFHGKQDAAIRELNRLAKQFDDVCNAPLASKGGDLLPVEHLKKHWRGQYESAIKSLRYELLGARYPFEPQSKAELPKLEAALREVCSKVRDGAIERITEEISKD